MGELTSRHRRAPYVRDGFVMTRLVNPIVTFLHLARRWLSRDERVESSRFERLLGVAWRSDERGACTRDHRGLVFSVAPIG